ncbi:MAG: holin [Lachnospiraceae bacterium]|nr:holin [Lachnospiraceae bacterium]
MFKNCVVKENVNTIKWFKAAGVRAVKTVAQTAVGMLVVGTPANEVDWINVLSVSAVAGIISVLTSIAGIPEVEEQEEK